MNTQWSIILNVKKGNFPFSAFIDICVSLFVHLRHHWCLAGKESACNAGDLGSIPGLGRSPGEGNGFRFQYSCLENSMDRGVWQATVHGVLKIEWLSLSLFNSLRTSEKGFTWLELAVPFTLPQTCWNKWLIHSQ